ncbi:phosducin-like protein [Diprion similis]|uniref:phosducin-like protein n=1 Tax=Diprion similis TaxID=362088 RepID=UPI001EF92408|nr:phosducin-like protein [Diprion similis]
MATLEDKILGEKLQYYCSSSSEDEGQDSADSEDDQKSQKPCDATASRSEQLPECAKWDGTSSNTGPKGVLGDWQRFKQMEAEKKIEQEKERIELLKKLSLTCRSALDEEKDKLEETDPELADLMNDEFLLNYQKQRMMEMLTQAEKLRFGRLFNLVNADQFLEAIDNEHESVTIVIHIYEPDIEGCETMNGCLLSLAVEYPNVKFCKIQGSAAGLSRHFKKEGVPALLVYKKKQVIGNFVRVTDHLGVDFYSSDVEHFLIEHGMITDRNCVPSIVFTKANADSDSD